jgi:hypothetical protein
LAGHPAGAKIKVMNMIERDHGAPRFRRRRVEQGGLTLTAAFYVALAGGVSTLSVGAISMTGAIRDASVPAAAQPVAASGHSDPGVIAGHVNSAGDPPTTGDRSDSPTPSGPTPQSYQSYPWGCAQQSSEWHASQTPESPTPSASAACSQSQGGGTRPDGRPFSYQSPSPEPDAKG